MPVDWDSDDGEKPTQPKKSSDGVITAVGKVGVDMAKGALHGLQAIEQGLGVFRGNDAYEDSEEGSEGDQEATWFAPSSRVLEWDKVQPPVSTQ